jgi:hypothetical protein
MIAAAGVGAWLHLARDGESLRAQPNIEAALWAEAYWQRPIAPQGPPPPHHLAAAKSLQPEDCGACHPAQYAGWKDSLHAAAMGPGVVGQFPTLSHAEQTECYACHAPLSEQYPRLPGPEGLAENAIHDAALAAKGLVCAACHLRGHQRHGPPLREGAAGVSSAVHGDPVRTPFFGSSEFCKGCHQHPESAMKVNGKPVENTYNEWLASPQAAEGITCQGCHMPDRQHLWRGIHDKEMTLSGVTIETEVPEAPRAGDNLKAVLRVTNTGTGHAFPTYTTPAVYLRAALIGADDRPLRGHYEEVILQRRLDMSTSPWGEDFDTRLLPGESAMVAFNRVIPAEAATLALWVWVNPDQFYNGFFTQKLEQGGANIPGRAPLAEALEATERRQYLLWSKRVPIVR